MPGAGLFQNLQEKAQQAINASPLAGHIPGTARPSSPDGQPSANQAAATGGTRSHALEALQYQIRAFGQQYSSVPIFVFSTAILTDERAFLARAPLLLRRSSRSKRESHLTSKASRGMPSLRAKTSTLGARQKLMISKTVRLVPIVRSANF